MPIPEGQHPAFRCRACGHLEAAASAGEHAVPAACSACGEGVKFSARGIKSGNPDNWEVLADAPPARLKELGLGQVARHAGKGEAPDGRHVHATAVDGAEAADRA